MASLQLMKFMNGFAILVLEYRYIHNIFLINTTSTKHFYLPTCIDMSSDHDQAVNIKIA